MSLFNHIFNYMKHAACGNECGNRLVMWGGGFVSAHRREERYGRLRSGGLCVCDLSEAIKGEIG